MIYTQYTHNPNTPQPTSPTVLVAGIWKHRRLIGKMAKREVIGRYQGSVMGLAWSFVTPILMLLVYTFVFSVVFRARWGVGGEEESRAQFAMVLFAGLIIYNLFAEVLNRAPNLIISNASYVKKVVFPLEILPVIALLSGLFHSVVSVGVLLCAIYFINGSMHWTFILLPFAFVPLILVVLGLSWILASLGVFLRDVGQTVSIITSVMMFLSPIFFPVSALPERFQAIMMANPLTFIIEMARDVLIWGQQPNWLVWAVYTAVSCVFAWLGFVWFQKTRKGFADVL